MDSTTNGHILIKKYFEENSFIQPIIESFNRFVDIEMQKIVDGIKEIVPTVLPPDIQEFKIRLGKIWIEKPQVIEADGSKRSVYPMEARIRKLTYAAPIFLEFSTFIDGVQRESFTAQIGKLPVMVKSKACNLYKMGTEELVKHGEDPYESGGYFIVNGNERAIIAVEDLMPNKVFFQKQSTGPSALTAKIFSQQDPYSIPHVIEQTKDGIIYISFTKFKRIPFVIIAKALGLTEDKGIMEMICTEKEYDDVYINLYNSVDIKRPEDALEYIARKIGLSQPMEIRIERAREQIDSFFLPHMGITPKDRMKKAYHLCKIIKKFLRISRDGLSIEDKDHYRNKKLKLAGELMADLFRVNMRILVNDMLYNFQRIVKRGKFQSVKIIIRDKLLTSRLKSAVATGSWVGGKKGISQNLDRINYIATLSHLLRIVSQLSTTQENFEAREVHSTHWGRLCPTETPEGTSIGLRKNFAMLCNITTEDVQRDKIKKQLVALGLNPIKTKEGGGKEGN